MKPTQTDSAGGPLQSSLQRRSFLRNAGAALSATVVASSAAVELAHKPATDAHRPATDENQIRQLHHDFVEQLNARRLDRPLVEPFERPLPDGLQRPVHDYLLGRAQHLDTIEVAADRRSATARFHCLTRVEATWAPTFPLIEMALQQGHGVIQWWESGVLENAYVKTGAGWRLARLAFRSSGPWLPSTRL